jgi:uncharacterized protein involved in exopolysaccharide biosynthesis
VTIIMFFLGLFLGGLLGCITMAFAAAAHNIDEYERGYYAGYRKAEVKP